MDVKSMKGLMRKEWILLKWGILALVFVNIAVVLVVPPLINRAFDLPMNTFENSLIISGTWFAFTISAGVVILFTSLEKEMKQPEIWMHSPAPMWQLVGIKAVFAVAVTGLILILNGVLLSISFMISDAYGTIPRFDGVLSMVSVMISIFLKSIYIMGFGFMFWSFYQIGRSRSKGLSVIFTTLLFFAGIFTGSVIAGLFRSIEFLMNIKGFGSVKLTELAFYNEQNSYFFTGIVPDGIVFSVGGLILYGAVTLIFFAVGAKVFEKKVRL
ncbi:hypothetical protein JSQ81_11875 [Sporosarcina sp. Marseille-Q4063]|uniref:hypothetical protein n=1 Tax=Sporosarcina sp. Marseille-Q4063 TaxID=2810514 RepID=UPI001BAFA2B9|nr:hypothetical protein [Sporosarcina sp. Marseille-Q4063]QUW20556.1 hypothetical protein JSQ81_11875 [Sporosarcina sp. Marseille-Q4063]